MPPVVAADPGPSKVLASQKVTYPPSGTGAAPLLVVVVAVTFTETPAFTAFDERTRLVEVGTVVTCPRWGGDTVTGEQSELLERYRTPPTREAP